MSSKLTCSDSSAKAEQSRINGAKSKGPTSVEGKARSSANALKHGFSAVINIVLRIEDKPAFDCHLQGFRASFKPNDYVEQSLVDQLAAINWRQSRLIALETALIDAQIDAQHDQVCELNPQSAADPYFHLVKAWQTLASQPQKPNEEQPKDTDINSLDLLRRYQTSLDRQFRNTLLNLRQYRKDLAHEEPDQNEPREAPLKTPIPPENRPVPAPIRPLTIVKPVSNDPTPPLTPENER